MEIFLNSAWALVAICLTCIWIYIEPRSGAHRLVPLVALIMLVVILFPVISVSDDLWSIQNPAETDGSPRRDQLVSNFHSIVPDIASLPEAPFAERSPQFARADAVAQRVSSVFDDAVLTAIENRPPPVA